MKKSKTKFTHKHVIEVSDACKASKDIRGIIAMHPLTKSFVFKVKPSLSNMVISSDELKDYHVNKMSELRQKLNSHFTITRTYHRDDNVHEWTIVRKAKERKEKL